MTEAKLFCSASVEICENTSSSTDNEITSCFALEHEEELKIISSLTEPTFEEIYPKLVTLGKEERKFTLLLDLDETLISRIVINLPNGEQDFIFKVRPYAVEALERLSKLYEIVIFTASTEDYAAKAVDSFDPERKYIKTILSKNSCVLTKQGYWVKDLRIISDRLLSRMLIVDNLVLSYAFHLENGVPITSFDGEEDDRELEYLAQYLEGLAINEDIVLFNKANIGL